MYGCVHNPDYLSAIHTVSTIMHYYTEMCTILAIQNERPAQWELFTATSA